jgi:ABC-type multidrug transport system permease subunit
MKNFLNLVIAIMKKNILNQSGYKLLFFYILWGSFFEIVVYFFTGKFVDKEGFSAMTGGMDYFSFIIIGYAFSDIFATCSISAINFISQERTYGTFESYVLSPRRLYSMILINLVPDILKAFVRILIFVAIGLFLGFRLEFLSSFFYLLSYTLVATLMFTFISLAISSLMLIDRRFRHICVAYISLSITFSSAFYPLGYLPNWLVTLIKYTPFNFAMSGLRSITRGSSGSEFLTISAFALLVGFASYYLFNTIETFARRRGSILRY